MVSLTTTTLTTNTDSFSFPNLANSFSQQPSQFSGTATDFSLATLQVTKDDSSTVTINGVNVDDILIDQPPGSFVGFDAAQYLASHPDLITAFGYNLEAAAQHYQTNGVVEGRSLDTFDEVLYLASNPDLIATFGYNPHAATQHYITAGFSERRPTQGFNAAAYIANYNDLQRAFGNDLGAATRHYVQYGYAEGRVF